MSDVQSLYCCGIKELHGIQDGETPEELLEQEGFSILNSCAFVIMSDAEMNDRKKGKKAHAEGRAMRAFIRKNKLGTLQTIRSKMNPNSGNRVQMYVWHVNHRNLSSVMKKIEKAATAKLDAEAREWAKRGGEKGFFSAVTGNWVSF